MNKGELNKKSSRMHSPQVKRSNECFGDIWVCQAERINFAWRCQKDVISDPIIGDAKEMLAPFVNNSALRSVQPLRFQ